MRADALVTGKDIFQRYLPWHLAVLAALAAAYYTTVSGMVFDWGHDENYSHGFIVPFIAGYFFWQNRKRIAEVTARPDIAGLLVVAAGVLAHILGRYIGELFTMRMSLLVVLAGVVLVVYGRAMLRAVLLPLGYLAFMVPLPYIVYDSVAFPLKMQVSRLAVALMKLVHIPVVREGNVIDLPNLSLQVVDACSGMRSLMSLLALSVAYAFIAIRAPWKRVVIVLSAVPIAVATNVLRVFITGVLARTFGRVAAEGFFHEFAGLAVFVIAMALLILLGWVLNLVWRDHA